MAATNGQNRVDLRAMKSSESAEKLQSIWRDAPQCPWQQEALELAGTLQANRRKKAQQPISDEARSLHLSMTKMRWQIREVKKQKLRMHVLRNLCFQAWARRNTDHIQTWRRTIHMQGTYCMVDNGLQPWEMVNLLLCLRQAQGTHLLLLAMFTWAATSCIRFEHFQRSYFVGEADTFLIFKCSQGKARPQGVPPPMSGLCRPDLPWRKPVEDRERLCSSRIAAWSAVPLAGRGASSRGVVASDGVDTLGGVQEDVQRAIVGAAAGHLDGPGGGPCSGTGRWLQPVAQILAHFGTNLSLAPH